MTKTNDVEVKETKEVEVSEEVHTEVVDLFDSCPEFISPYKLSSFLSVLMGRKINPQMMYNYSKKSSLLPTSLSTTQKLQVSKEDSIRFCEVYVTRNRK